MLCFYIISGTINNDFCHSGELNDYFGALIETNGVIVVWINIARVCNSNTVFHPNLFRSSTFGSLRRIVKGDGCLCLSGLLSTANRANAICILVTCGDGFGFSVVTTGISTGLLLFTVFGASSVCNYLPIAVVVAEFTNGFNLFIIAVFASDGLGTRFGASCSLGDRLYIFMFASIIAACCCGEGDFNVFKTNLSIAMYPFGGCVIDFDGTNSSGSSRLIASSFRACAKRGCIFGFRTGDYYLYNCFTVFAVESNLCVLIRTEMIGVACNNCIGGFVFINNNIEVLGCPNNA